MDRPFVVGRCVDLPMTPALRAVGGELGLDVNALTATAVGDHSVVLTTTRYCVVQDDSCHWYLIPANRRDDWNAFLESEACELGDVPDYARRIDGVSMLTFTDPKED